MAYWTRVLMTAASVAALTGSAVAQTSDEDTTATPSAPVPYTAAVPATGDDMGWLRTGLAAARSGNLDQLRSAEASVSQPVARKLLEWASADAMAARLSFAEIDKARRDLAGWPHKANRQAAAERALEPSGLSAQQIADWFTVEPATPEGAMTLIAAYQQLGRNDDAQALVRHFWRDRAFDIDAQRQMLARFGAMLTQEDHVHRADTLLYGQPGPALRDVLALLPADQQQAAEARMALRAGSSSAEGLYNALPPEHQHDAGVAVERARWLYDRDRGLEALPLIADFPTNPPGDASSRFWLLRRQLVNVAVKAGDYATAHKAVDAHGLPPGAEAADAEFLGGWLALTKLHDPVDAERHFARLEFMGASPITISRALYWRGRAEEAMGDPVAAQSYYGRGAKYYTAFYGQMAAAKAGMTEIDLGLDPVATAQDKARFNAQELVQAARLLSQVGAPHELYRSIIVAAADSLPRLVDIAQLADMTEAGGDQDLTMRVTRLAAQRGLTLPERGYPLRSTPDTSPVEAPLVLGIIRQESGFDARIRSGVGARGMMQLMPATAKRLAARSGVRYRDTMLDNPDYNMRLGSNFLGDLVSNFDGSYIMAAAAYNAGPSRPSQWTASCGDPRSASVDPVDYIECIPIGETRNYVMRVLENVQVYRARLNGGRAPLTLPADLKRGGYGQPRPYAQVAQNTLTVTPVATDVVASTPVPDPPETPRLIRGRDDDQPGHHLRPKKVSAKAKTAHHRAKRKKSASSDN